MAQLNVADVNDVKAALDVIGGSLEELKGIAVKTQDAVASADQRAQGSNALLNKISEETVAILKIVNDAITSFNEASEHIIRTARLHNEATDGDLATNL